MKISILGWLYFLSPSDSFVTKHPLSRFFWGHLRRAPVSVRLAEQSPSFEFTVGLDNGVEVQVSLSCEDDAKSVATEILALNPGIKATDDNLATVLRDQFRMLKPQQMSGPKLESGQHLNNLVASLPVGKTGIILEIAESLLGPHAGFGLFLRKDSNLKSPDPTMFKGQPLCGYAGRPSASPQEEGGGTIVNFFTSLDSEVFFQNELQTLRRVIASKGVDSVVGHRISRDPRGIPIGIEPDETYSGEYRYFVPEDSEGITFSLMSVGQFANDLAVTAAPECTIRIKSSSLADDGPCDVESAYSEASEVENLLSLTFRMELESGTEGARLIPQPPILTFRQSVVISNEAPIEVGCHYGVQYWKEALNSK